VAAAELIPVNSVGRAQWYVKERRVMSNRVNSNDARRPQMNRSNLGPLPAESPQEKDLTVDGGVQQPMSQQDVADSHGHEIHPQKFVRLVGCHETNAGKH
jgi:hypothetical protein